MGGLVADIENFSDPSNQIGGPKWREQVAAHWLEASNNHGMPVDIRIWHDTGNGGFTSTYPASIAYKSAQFQNEIKANRFLRMMREGAAAEYKFIQKPEVQAELAGEAGLNSDRLIKDIKSGRAERAFKEELKECRRQGITGFPTFLIRDLNSKEKLILGGYRRFNEFVNAFHELTGDTINPTFPEVNEDSIITFVRKYKKVAEREIQEVFDLSKEDTDKYISLLISERSMVKKKVGNGFFYIA